MTGTIARTATNVRAGGRSPLSGMFHRGFVLAFMIAAAPLASFIPLATLAGVLAVVAWNMAEKQAFATLLRASLGDGLVLLVTLGLVVFRDLSTGILAGFGLSMLLFLHRMAKSVEVEGGVPQMGSDMADSANGDRRVPYDPALATDRDIMLYRISGAFFFGAAAGVAAALDRIGEHPRAYVIDFSAVPMINSDRRGDHRGFRASCASTGCRDLSCRGEAGGASTACRSWAGRARSRLQGKRCKCARIRAPAPAPPQAGAAAGAGSLTPRAGPSDCPAFTQQQHVAAHRAEAATERR